jgi:hypothetical protein
LRISKRTGSIVIKYLPRPLWLLILAYRLVPSNGTPFISLQRSRPKSIV